MTMLAINWGFALLVTVVGMVVVFLLLIVLIWIINLQTSIIHGSKKSPKRVEAKVDSVVTTEEHPTPHEQAAIAMAMHLYFDAHDEEPHVITIQEVARRYSPWSSKIYSMRNFTK